jgi:hypothetical protein
MQRGHTRRAKLAHSLGGTNAGVHPAAEHHHRFDLLRLCHRSQSAKTMILKALNL